MLYNIPEYCPTNLVSISLTTEEWMTAIQFLTSVGQKCTDIRQEFILLSDVMGISALVDALNNPAVGNATESSVLGPFFTEDAIECKRLLDRSFLAILTKVPLIFQMLTVTPSPRRGKETICW